MKRQAIAIWKGSIQNGEGTLSSQSEVLQHTPFTFKSRFEEGSGTNPEELIAASHAGCFAMQLTAFLTEEDYDPERLEAKGEVTLENGIITSSHITLTAKIDTIKHDKFKELVQKAKTNCPISKLLNTEIKVDATLI